MTRLLETGIAALCLLALLAAVIGGLVTTIKPFLEASCNQRGSELGAVDDGDYRLMSDTCYLTLRDGTVIPAYQYRATEGVDR